MRQVFTTICYLIVIIVNIAFTGDTVESDGVLETVTDEVHSVEDYQYVLGYKNMNIPEQEISRPTPVNKFIRKPELMKIGTLPRITRNGLVKQPQMQILGQTVEMENFWQLDREMGV